MDTPEDWQEKRIENKMDHPCPPGGKKMRQDGREWEILGASPAGAQEVLPRAAAGFPPRSLAGLQAGCWVNWQCYPLLSAVRCWMGAHCVILQTVECWAGSGNSIAAVPSCQVAMPVPSSHPYAAQNACGRSNGVQDACFGHEPIGHTALAFVCAGPIALHGLGGHLKASLAECWQGMKICWWALGPKVVERASWSGRFQMQVEGLWVNSWNDLGDLAECLLASRHLLVVVQAQAAGE